MVTCEYRVFSLVADNPAPENRPFTRTALPHGGLGD